MFYNYNVKIQNKRYLHVLIATAVVLASGFFAVSQERIVGSVINGQESVAIHSKSDQNVRRSLIVQRAKEEVEDMQFVMAAEAAVRHAGAPVSQPVWMKIVDEVARWFGLGR